MNSEHAHKPVKVDIVSGFLGAGKTTFINKLLEDGLAAQDVVVIENELGDTPIDDVLLDANGIRMRTLASGCICCSLSADFATSVIDIVRTCAPGRIVVEPTGVAGASEIARICEKEIWQVELEVGSIITIVNAENLPDMIEMELEAFERQVEEAHFVLLSRSEHMEPEKLDAVCDALSGLVEAGTILYRGSWDDADALEILTLAEEAYAAHRKRGRKAAFPDVDGHGHEHGRDDLTALSLVPQRPLSAAETADITCTLENGAAGVVLRAKGFLVEDGGGFVLYEYVYGSGKVQRCPNYTGNPKMIVIGRQLDQAALSRLFGSARVAASHAHRH